MLGAARAERLTLDTNIPREWWSNQAKGAVFDQLLSLAAAGRADLAVTRHIEDDVPHEPLAQRVRELPTLDVAIIGGIFIIGGPSLINGPDLIGDGSFDRFEAQLRNDWRPGDRRVPEPTDFLHLHAHMLHHRDVFLTWDGAILDLAGRLGTECGISVMAPETYLASTRARTGAQHRKP